MSHPFDPVTTPDEARAFLRWLCQKFPQGFHPEDDLRDTVGGDALPENLVGYAELRRRECFGVLDDVCAEVDTIATSLGQSHSCEGITYADQDRYIPNMQVEAAQMAIGLSDDEGTIQALDTLKIFGMSDPTRHTTMHVESALALLGGVRK